MKVVVTTPTGNIGRVLTDRLLDAGTELTLIARNPDKVQAFADRGARVIQGSLDDEALVTKATSGTECLFWLTPPSFVAEDFRAYQNAFGRIAAAAVRANRIPRVVHLSSVGAQWDSGTGPVLGLHDNERRLNDVATGVTHLRPGMFMENYLGFLDAIRSMKSVFVPLPGGFKTRFIATRDIAHFAAECILDTDWRGQHEWELHGPESLSFDGAAAAISEALGEPVRHVEVTPEQTREALRGMGASENAAETFVALYEGIRKGLLEPVQPVRPENTGSTTFAQFAREVLAPAVRGAPVG